MLLKNNKKTAFYAGLFIILLFANCKSSKNLISVRNINEKENYKPTEFIYSLPKTKVFIVVEVTKIVSTKGVFAEYTEKYLGSLKKVSKNRTSYRVSDISFYSKPIQDNSQIYVVSNPEFENTFAINVTQEGFPVSVNMPEIVAENFNSDIFSDKKFKEKNITQTFNTLTSEKNYKVVYDTIYREEFFDSLIRKVPVLKKNVILKTPEEQAKDLADQILVLRDDRSALLVGEGDSDYLPDGNSLKIMLQGIDKLEKQYLSMFVGRTDTIKYRYTYSYVPEDNDYYKKIILFKFSNSTGVLSSESLSGTPYCLEIEANDYIKNIKKFQETQALFEQVEKKDKNVGLVYRIPQKAIFRVLENKKIIKYQEIFVPQLGTTEALPAEIFKNNVKIQFFPDLGALKSIDIQKIKQ